KHSMTARARVLTAVAAGYVTSQAIATVTGLGRVRVASHLNKLAKQGRIVCNGMVASVPPGSHAYCWRLRRPDDEPRDRRAMAAYATATGEGASRSCARARDGLYRRSGVRLRPPRHHGASPIGGE